jgi:hypothetical protein
MIAFQYFGEPKYYEKLSTALTAATGITSSYLNPAALGGLPIRAALVTCEVAAVRFTQDGTTPTTLATTGIGHQLQVGGNIMIIGFEACKQFKAIEDAASSGAILHLTYFY